MSFEIRSRFSQPLAWAMVALVVIVFVPGIIYSVATRQTGVVVLLVAVFVTAWCTAVLRLASLRVVADASGLFVRNARFSRRLPWSEIEAFHLREHRSRLSMVDVELRTTELIALTATARARPAQVEMFVAALSAWLTPR